MRRSFDKSRTCTCKTARWRLVEYRKKHERLAVMTETTKHLDGVGRGGQGSV